MAQVDVVLRVGRDLNALLVQLLDLLPGHVVLATQEPGRDVGGGGKGKLPEEGGGVGVEVLVTIVEGEDYGMRGQWLGPRQGEVEILHRDGVPAMVFEVLQLQAEVTRCHGQVVA